MKKIAIIIAVVIVVLSTTTPCAFAGDKYRIAWSHYTGWEPWQYILDSGIIDKWAKKYNCEIDIILVNDYIESINMYTTGQFDGCTMTNMDALAIPAIGGVDSTVLIIGDFSNGNDGIVLLNGKTVKDLKGRKLRIVELSVSHYLLTRALDMNGMTERDLTIINTSDADIAGLFITESERDQKAAVCTWNPPLMQVRNVKGARMVFDSSSIPGEIIDCLVVRSNLPENAKKALVGAWFEAMGIMSRRSKTGSSAVKAMAKFAGGTLREFQAQLKTTSMFYNAKDAADFARSPKIKETMEYVRTFSFDHGLYGEDAPDKDVVGIAFDDGSTMGNKNNVKLRFPAKYMQMAADGKL